MRVGAYYAPDPGDPLARAAATWLGRDAESDAPMPQPDLPDIAAITRDARLYGFHATLKPPMRLGDGVSWGDVRGATRAVAACIAPFALPPLAPAALHGFVALRETTPCQDLQGLADAVIAGLDPLRAPPDEAELQRRRRGQLTPLQDAMLLRWGYPYVFQTWFFHMTLTRKLAEDQRPFWIDAATAHFAEALRAPRRVTAIALFTQAAPGAPFKIAERIPLE